MPFISDTKKFVFIANARCASTSIYKELAGQSINDDVEWPSGKFCKGINAEPEVYHMSLKDTIDVYPRTKDYFKFAFVRNPWSRFLSLYLRCNPTRSPSAIAGVDYDIWASDMLNYDSFESFCLGFESSRMVNQIHFFPLSEQCDLLGESKIDFIGKYENISSDYEKLSTILNLPTKLSFWENSRRDYSNNNDYRSLYTEEMAEKIYNYYIKDVKSFNYEF